MAQNSTERIADSILPLDGPYDQNSMADAGAVIGELVRRLNHATMAHNAPDALPYPQDVARLIDDLATATERLPQLLAQIAYRIGFLALDERLIVDQRMPEQRPAFVTGTAAQYLTDAQGFLHEAATALVRVQGSTSRLSWIHDED